MKIDYCTGTMFCNSRWAGLGWASTARDYWRENFDAHGREGTKLVYRSTIINNEQIYLSNYILFILTSITNGKQVHDYAHAASMINDDILLSTDD